MQGSRRWLGALIIAALLVASTEAEALQCVPFAREVSGISLRGDAWTWWTAAAGQYERGQMPRPGAVVVFKRHGSMRHGHVAVVTRVVSSREVLVDHANWAPSRGRGRGQISKMVAVTDVSARNDWTEVRVWNAATGDFGTRTYPTYGFIYPAAKPHPTHAARPAEAMPSMPAPPAECRLEPDGPGGLLVTLQDSNHVKFDAISLEASPPAGTAADDRTPGEQDRLAKRFDSDRY